MIFIGLGANLPSRAGSPRETLEAALADLKRRGVLILARSRWYETAPVPLSDQPWFVNGVAALGTSLGPAALLALLHAIEDDYGRERRAVNGARTLDLDLLLYDDMVNSGVTEGVFSSPILPHPRLSERAFVLKPLAELVNPVLPDWRHPVTGATLDALLARLDAGQETRPLAD